jgi:hypothetical protein
VAGILLAVTRQSAHLLDVGRGLFLVALWSCIGILGPASALRAGDAFSAWVLDRASGGHVADRLLKLAGLNAVNSSGAVIVLGLALMLAGLLQAVLMVFREGAIVVPAGVVVLAASGQFTRATRPWLPKVTGWMLALICFKPAAALVYATALTMVGEGDDPRMVLVGLSMLVLAALALPALMKFFTWATGAAAPAGGGGMAATAAAAASAIHATATLSGGSYRNAADHAAHLRRDLGGDMGSAPHGAATTVPPAATASAAGAAPAATAATVALPGAQAATALHRTAQASADRGTGEKER